MKNIFNPLFIIFILVSCRQPPFSDKISDKQVANNPKEVRQIVIQPYDDINSKTLIYIVSEIKKVYPFIKVNDPLPLPKSSFHFPNHRFRADSIIAIQKRICQNKYTILGLTSKDISTTKGDKEDWGVMGLGYCPGSSCIVSTFRLRGSNKLDKFRKVTLHELAHTEGLPHCPDLHCYMRDAKGKDYLNEEIDFCEKCKKVLKGKGWRL